MMIGRAVAYLGVCMLAFAMLAIAGMGCVKLGEMLAGVDASWAKAVIIAGVLGFVVVLLAGWWDASHECDRRS
jgi:hypothetical protein